MERLSEVSRVINPLTKLILKSSYLNIILFYRVLRNSLNTFSSLWDAVPELTTLPCSLSLMLWDWKVRFPPFFFYHVFPLWRKRSLENGINIWHINILAHPCEKRSYQELKVLRNSLLFGITPEARCTSAAGFRMFLSIIDPMLGTPRLFRQRFFQTGVYLLSGHSELLSPPQRGISWWSRSSSAVGLHCCKPQPAPGACTGALWVFLHSGIYFTAQIKLPSYLWEETQNRILPVPMSSPAALSSRDPHCCFRLNHLLGNLGWKFLTTSSRSCLSAGCLFSLPRWPGR